MQVPEKEIQGKSPSDESNSKPSYKPKKFLRTRYEEALSNEENSSSSNGSSLGANQLEQVTTAAAQSPLPFNLRPPSPSPTPPMIELLKHEIEDDGNKWGATETLSKFNQPEGVSIFCNDFQKAEGSLVKSEFSGEDVFEQDHFYWTGYSPPLTLSHLAQFSVLEVLEPPPPPPKSEEAPVEQPTVYCNAPPTPSSISCTSAVDNAEATREQIENDGTSQNPERSVIDIRRIVTNPAALPPLPPGSPPPFIVVKHERHEDDENECGATESFSEYNQSEELTSATPLTEIRSIVTNPAALPPLPPGSPPPMIVVKQERHEDDENKCGATERFSEYNQSEELTSATPVIKIRSIVTNPAALPPLPPGSPLPMIVVKHERHEDNENKCGATESFSEYNQSEELTSATPVTKIQRIVTNPAALPPLPPGSPPPMIVVKHERHEDNENKYGATESFSEYNQSKELTSAAPVTMCRDFVRGHCRLGADCKFKHHIILSQLPGIYTFCKDYQNSVCSSKTCESVHATIFEEEHFLRTGYLPLLTRAHLIEFSLLLPPPPPPKSEEAPEEQPKVYCNAPSPLPPISCTLAVDNTEAIREQSEPENVKVQPGISTSSQNPVRSEISILKKYKTAGAQPHLPPNPPPSNGNKSGSTESLTEFKQQEELTAAVPVTTTIQSEEQASVTEHVMCKNFVRGTCKNGMACKYKHEIILSQLREVYTFCRDFQNSGCFFPNCKFVHAIVFEEKHFYRTGYLPPHTLAHLKQHNVLAPAPPAPQSEEASAEQPIVYCNAPSPSPKISGTLAVVNAGATRERSETDIVRAQPGTRNSPQNPVRSEIDIRKKYITARAQPTLPPNPQLRNENKCDDIKSLTEFNQQGVLAAAGPVTTTAESDKQPTVTMCRNFVRGTCMRGADCIFAHEIILSQLPGVYTFCRNYQNSVCSFPKCKFVHATVFEKEHFYRTGYLPPHTLAHLRRRSIYLALPPAASQSEEASATQSASTVYCNVALPPPTISCTLPTGVGYSAEAAGHHVPDTFRAQPGTSISSQNPEWSEIESASSSSREPDSARSHNDCISREEREMADKIADARRQLQKKKEQYARLDWECQMMDLLISTYNHIVNQNSQDAEPTNRHRDRN